MPNKTYNKVQLRVKFTQASDRANIGNSDTNGENIAISFGKLSKWYEALVPTGGSSGKILTWNTAGTAKWSDPLHPSITKSADTTSTASPAHGGTFTTVDTVTRDAYGHVTKINTKTITLPADSNTDTKVTQSSSTTSDFRPLLLGKNNQTNPENLETTVTDQTYVTKHVFVQPSTGNLTLYNASGDSPSLIFRRGTMIDNTLEWRIQNVGGKLNFDRDKNESTETWENIFQLDPSNNKLYFKNTEVSLSGHTHNYVPNTQAGVNAAINLLSTGSSTPSLADYYVSQYANGGTTTTSYHRRPISALWDAFKGLITLTTTGSGNAVTAVSIANDGDNNRKITVTKGSTFSLSTHTHSNYLPMSTVSSSTDADTLFTTSQWINWNTTTKVETTHMPTTNYGILLAKAYPGIQVFIPDSAAGIYFRKKTNANTAATAWWGITGTSGSTYNLANFYDSTISRTANTVLAAPDGSNGEATFRKLVAADIPYLNYSGVASSWWNDRDNAVIRLTKADSSYRPLWSLLTSTTGSWAVGNHNNDDLVFNFISKATYDTGSNPASDAYKQVKFTNAGGITTTGAITASGTGTFKTGDFGTQLIVERTGGANMAGITFKNTNGVLGYIAANTVDGDLYHYGASDTSTMKYTILDSNNYKSYEIVLRRGNAGKSNMNDVGRLHASVGMTELSDPGNNYDNPMNGTTKSTSWHLYWDASYKDDPNGSNSWVAQIANKAGTAQWWVRSRKGGTITNGTEWAAGWEHLTITSQAGAGSATNPVYVDSNGHTQACTYSLNKTVPSNAVFTDANVTQTPADSTYTNYRPLLIGASGSSSPGFTPTLGTAGTYAAAGIYCQPSSGKIYATELVTNTYPSASGSALTQYGLNLKSYKKASLPAGGDYSYSRTAVRVYDGKSGDSSGMLLEICSGGLTIVGGGESASSLAALVTDDQRDANTSRTRLDVGGTLNTAYHGSSEQLILSSDNNIYFLTACNTITGRKPVCLDTSSYFYPGTNNTGSIGTTSYYWASAYIGNIHGTLDGTASAWTTARTLTLSGQLTGSVSIKGDANMTLKGYLDRAFIYDDNAVPDGHTWAEYAWHKFAEVTITDVWTDCVITFLVSRTYTSSAENTGILSAKLRTKGNKGYDSAQLKWLVRDSGLSKDDFVMVYTSTSGTSTKAELWCRIPAQNHGLVFTVLKEHKRQYSTDTSWTLVKTPNGSGSTHGSSSYPTTGITGTIISSDGTITNSTTGNAATATKATKIATEAGSSAGERPVFYAYLGDNTRVVYNTSFTYNPGLSGGVLYTPYTASKLRTLVTTRQSSLNLTTAGVPSMQLLLATSSCSTGKPAQDGYVLCFDWDNSGNYQSQFFIPAGYNAPPQYRCQGGSSTWQNSGWIDIGTHRVIYTNDNNTSTIVDNIAVPTHTQTVKIMFKSSSGVYSMVEVPYLSSGKYATGLVQVGSLSDGSGAARIIMKSFILTYGTGSSSGVKFSFSFSQSEQVNGTTVSQTSQNLYPVKLIACT